MQRGGRGGNARAVTRSRRLAWLLLLAALQAVIAFGPPARAHGGPWIEVCSAAGVKRLPADPGQPAAHEDHCPLCRLADTAHGPPPPARPAAATAPRGYVVRGSVLTAPGGTPPGDALARAPPAQ
jgi:hypothetical protein